MLKVSEKKNSSIKELTEVFNLPLAKYVESYSTGMKKKLSFLGLLLLGKSIYILDEPFNGIDMESVELFKSIIKNLKERGCTILISSHIISSLTDMCSDIYFLNDGVFAKKYEKHNFNKILEETSTLQINKISSVLKAVQ